jgi:glycosyltransferase involved in cell wall biosynthesis
MLISLVHPSRGRVDRAAAAIDEWRSQAAGTHAIEHILSVDDDDPDLSGYRSLAERAGSRLIEHPNRRMVEAMNRGAVAATGGLLVGMSDDFGCPPGWDDSLAALVRERARAAILVDDGIDARILTIPILTRALYEQIGYLYHPAYVSMFADDDLTETARRLDALIDARHLRFPHRHFHVNPAVDDATYARQNSNSAWWHGWRVFEKRKLEGFGTGRRTLGVRRRQLQIDIYYYGRTIGSRIKQTCLGALAR